MWYSCGVVSVQTLLVALGWSWQAPICMCAVRNCWVETVCVGLCGQKVTCVAVFAVQGLPVKPPNYVYKQRVAPGVVVRERKAPAAASRAPGSTAGTARKAKKRPAASRGFEMSATMA